MDKTYKIIEINTNRVFDIVAESANKALKKASGKYKRLYGIYPSEKEFKLI